MKDKKAHDKAITDYYNILKDTDTVFGSPRIFNIPLMGGKCVVFGPSAMGDHVYIYKLGDKDAGVSYAQSLDFFDEPREELTALMDNAEKSLKKGSNTLTRAMYAQVLTSRLYDILDGKKAQLEGVPDDLGEVFGIVLPSSSGEDMIFEDAKNNPVFKISGSFSKGLRLDLPSGERVYEVRREEDGYTVLKHGCEFARFSRGDACLETADGTITAETLSDIIGTSILLYLDGEIIGTVCRELNAGFTDVIKHAHAIHVRHPKHTPLIALLSILLTGIAER